MSKRQLANAYKSQQVALVHDRMKQATAIAERLEENKRIVLEERERLALIQRVKRHNNAPLEDGDKVEAAASALILAAQSTPYAGVVIEPVENIDPKQFVALTIAIKRKCRNTDFRFVEARSTAICGWDFVLTYKPRSRRLAA